MSKSLPANRRSGDLIFDYIRGQIVSGDLRAGSRIDQDTLATELDVSRTPIREALLRLESEGFIETRPYRGAVVRGINPEFVDEIYALRIPIEGIAARMSAPKITDEALSRATELFRALMPESDENSDAAVDLNHRFHFTLYEATGSDEFMRLVEPLFRHSERMWSFYRVEGGLNLVAAHHAAVLEAFRARDGQTAERAIRTHLLEVFALMLKPHVSVDELQFVPYVLSDDEIASLEAIMTRDNALGPC